MYTIYHKEVTPDPYNTDGTPEVGLECPVADSY